MGALTLATFRSNLRKDLVDAATFYSNDEIDRAVTKAYADLNRFLPRELYYETTLRFTVTAEAWTSTAHGTYVTLTYKPIKDLSETVTNSGATVTYTRDTDYTIDYVNGKITTISGGGMSNTTVYKITYTRSKIAVDLSSLTALIRILGVEYPANQVPTVGVSAELFADLLWIQCGEDTQTEATQYKHVLVRYLATHTVPTADVAGTCPTFLEETLSLAASAYLMYCKAAYYEQLVATALAAAGSELGLTTAVHTTVGTALGAIKTNHDLAIVALAAGKAIVGAISFTASTDELALANSALDTLIAATTGPYALLDAALAKVNTYLAGGSESTKAQLALIATDATALRTAIGTAVGAAVTALGLVTSTDLTNAAGVWADEVKHILNGDSGATPSMELHLELGDDFINTINTGSDVAALYAQYATTVANMQRAWAQKRQDLLNAGIARTQQASAYLAEAGMRLENLKTYIEQARGYSIISDGFIAEANMWIGKCNSYISEASQRIATAQGYISIEGMKLYQVDRYLEEATRYTNIAGGYANEAMYRIGQIDRYLAEADAYIAQSDRYMLLADKFRADGTERRNEAWAIWADKKQLTGKLSDISNRQQVR